MRRGERLMEQRFPLFARRLPAIRPRPAFAITGFLELFACVFVAEPYSPRPHLHARLSLLISCGHPMNVATPQRRNAALLFGAVLCLAGSVLTALFGLHEPIPKEVLLRKPLHDFGKVEPDSKCETTFEILNNSGATVKITEVLQSCGCIATSISPGVLQHGEVARLNAQLQVGTDRGNLRRSLQIGYTTNGSSHPRFITGYLMATVVTRVTSLEGASYVSLR